MAPLLSDAQFADRLRRNRARLLGQLVALRRLATSINRCVSPLEDWVAPSLRGASVKDVAPWWTRRDDSVLCVGAYMHGIRAIEDIRNDTSLPFTISIATGGGGEAGDAEEEEEEEEKEEGNNKAEGKEGSGGGGVSSSVLEKRLKQLLDGVHEREYQLELYEAQHYPE